MAQPPKVLMVATVEIHILTFHLPYLQYFNEQGYEVHVACAGESDIPYCHVKHTLPFARSPFKTGNIRAYAALKALIDKNRYEIIHAHTPVGGVIARWAAASARKRCGTKVIYTAHGFQFYRGGPMKDWLLYYPVEKYMAPMTDILITLNQEDYDTARRKKFKAGAIKKINGIGLEGARFQTHKTPAALADIKAAIGLGRDDFVLLCVGEINKNKNQGFLLEVLRALQADAAVQTPVKLVLAGPDSLNGALQKKAAALHLSDAVIFLGYRKDIPALLSIADIGVSASLREGLPFNVLEAMAAGKPVIVTDIRGHRDLVSQGINGLRVKKNDKAAFIAAVKDLYAHPKTRQAMGQAGAEMTQAFALSTVLSQMQEIYNTAIHMKT